MKHIPIYLFFITGALHAQVRVGFTTNLMQLPYQCYELGLLLSTENRDLQLIGNFNYTNAQTNGFQKRNVKTFDENYMKSHNEYLKGPGYGAQLRILLKKTEMEEAWRFYAAAGFNVYKYKVEFYENEYVYNPPFYSYSLQKYEDKIDRTTADIQFLVNYTQGMVTCDFGIGLMYSFINSSESLKEHRRFDASLFDYGYRGLAPVLSIRVGVLF